VDEVNAAEPCSVAEERDSKEWDKEVGRAASNKVVNTTTTEVDEVGVDAVLAGETMTSLNGTVMLPSTSGQTG
jgi:hypothetical protein